MKLSDLKTQKTPPMISLRKVEKITLISVSSFYNLPGLKKDPL